MERAPRSLAHGCTLSPTKPNEPENLMKDNSHTPAHRSAGTLQPDPRIELHQPLPGHSTTHSNAVPHPPTHSHAHRTYRGRESGRSRLAPVQWTRGKRGSQSRGTPMPGTRAAQAQRPKHSSYARPRTHPTSTTITAGTTGVSDPEPFDFVFCLIGSGDLCREVSRLVNSSMVPARANDTLGT